MGNFGAFFAFLIPVGILGVIVFFVMAIVAEAKSASRGSAVRSAFSYSVSLIMLFIISATVAFLLQVGLRGWVFTKAVSPTVMNGMPPSLYLATEKGIGSQAAYACTDTCEFTQNDRESLTVWKQNYASWRENYKSTTGRFTLNDKRDVVNAVSFIIVAVPLFWWFFMRSVQREARKLRTESHGKPGPLRSSYFYLVAFTGLIGLVVSGAMLVNLGLKRVTGLQSDAGSRSAPSMVVPPYEQNGVKSIVNCAEKCGFTEDDTTLAAQWLADYDAWQKSGANQYPPANSVHTDLANLIPVVLVSLPLFLYHFIVVRRETADDVPNAPTTPVASA